MDQKPDILKKRPKRTATGEPVDKIIIDPPIAKITSGPDATDEAVITFGKFNPPHAGHERLVEHIKFLAEEKNATPLVFLSHSGGLLEYDLKLNLCRAAFGFDVVVESTHRDLFQVLENMQDFKRVTVVVGSDRFAEFSERLPKYFDNVEIVEFEREGESSTALREAVWNDDLETFTAALPTKLQSAADGLFDLFHSSKAPSSMLKERAMALAWQLVRPNIDHVEPVTGDTKMSDKLRYQKVNRLHKFKRILDTGAA